jgi:hypothetical protein
VKQLSASETSEISDKVFALRGSAFFAGFSGLAYQVIAYKLILAAGLGDGLSIALSLTAFVTLSGIGAMLVSRFSERLAEKVEVLLAVYGLVLFGGILSAGLVAYIEFLDQFSAFTKLSVILAIQAPLAFLSGALMPIYDRRRRSLSGDGRFPMIYSLFHLGGAAALVLIENVLFPSQGYLMAGIGLSLLSLINGSLAMKEPVIPEDRSRRSAGLIRATLLFAVSVATGVLGIAIYKAFDHIVGPNIRNYTAVTSAIFLGLGLSGWLASKRAISIRSAISLSGAGICLLLAALVTLPSFVLLAISAGLPATVAYGLSAFILCVPTYGLIGLSVPVFVRDGMTASHALFVCAVGNCVGYWLYIGASPWAIDFAALAVFALLMLALTRSYRPILSTAATLVGLTLAGFQVLPSVHHTILAERLTTEAEIKAGIMQDHPNEEWRFVTKQSWASWGSPVDHVGVYGPQSAEDAQREYLVINGFKSLRVDHVPSLQYGEAASALIPTLYASRTNDALVIGAGTGISAGATTALFDRVDLVDLNPDTSDMLNHFSGVNRAAGQRTTLYEQDAFSFLSQSDHYDYVFGTATGAGYAFSALLYSQEFFSRVQSSLGDGGVFAFWLDARSPIDPTASQILAALNAVFGHVKDLTVFPGQIAVDNSLPYTVFIASDSPLEIQPHAYGVIEYLQGFSPQRVKYAGHDIDTFLASREIDVQVDRAAPAASIDTVAYAYGYRYEIQIFEEMVDIWSEMAKTRQTSP